VFLCSAGGSEDSFSGEWCEVVALLADFLVADDIRHSLSLVLKEALVVLFECFLDGLHFLVMVFFSHLEGAWIQSEFGV